MSCVMDMTASPTPSFGAWSLMNLPKLKTAIEAIAAALNE
jgi:hypothetical protein